MSASVRVNNIDTALRPTRTLTGALIADQKLALTSNTAMIATPLNDLTTHVYWTADGADARFTLDDSSATASNGHYVVDKDSGIWNRETAEAAKWISIDGTSINVHITEMTEH